MKRLKPKPKLGRTAAAAALAAGTLAATPVGAADVVHDPIHTVLNVLQQCIGQASQATYHVQDVAKYAEMIDKQVEQINQLTTVINQNVDELRRFGSPDTYVNMLGLDELLDEIEKTKEGVGKTVSDVRRTVDGVRALRGTAEGLYDDLSNLPDRFGQKVQFEADRFKKFGAVQDLYEDYNREQANTNEAIRKLQTEKAGTLNQLNAAGSLVEVQKFTAKLQAVQTSLDNLYARAGHSAMKVLVQEAANRNDEARRVEAGAQRATQEAVASAAELQQALRAAVHVID